MSENEAIAALLAKGYTVAVKDPTATLFNKRYSVYREFPKPCDKRYVYTDGKGNPTSAQG